MYSKIFQNTVAKVAIAPQATSGTTAITSVVVDRLGFTSGIVVVTTNGASDATNAVTLTMTVNEGSTTSPVTAVTFTATLSTLVSSATTATQTVSTWLLELTGFNRYFKIVLTPSYGAGTPTVIVGAAVLLTDAVIDPASGSADAVYFHA